MAAVRPVFSPLILLQLTLHLLVVPLLPIFISGRLRWAEVWVLAALQIAGFIVSRALAAKHNPGILEERARSMQAADAKGWDRPLVLALFLGNALMLAVAGLNDRLGWGDPLRPELKAAALAVVVAGHSFASWALIVNRFFSGVVRIQHDRDHRVVDRGPYRIIRHPGYAGWVWASLATPIVLDALWALIPATLAVMVLIVRTGLEDQTLRQELPGYEQFTARTRYRLFPGIW